VVPNPAKARAGDQISDARAQLAAARRGISDEIDAAGIRARQPGSGGKASVDRAAGQALTSPAADLTAAKAASRGIPSHLPIGQVRPNANCSPTPSG
jgi:hypothetical protein